MEHGGIYAWTIRANAREAIPGPRARPICERLLISCACAFAGETPGVAFSALIPSSRRLARDGVARSRVEVLDDKLILSLVTGIAGGDRDAYIWGIWFEQESPLA